MFSAILRSLVVFVSCLALFVTSSPTPVRNSNAPPRRSFTVPRVRNRNFGGYDGPTELLKAYRKHAMPIPRGLQQKVAARRVKRSLQARAAGGQNAGSVPAIPVGNGIEYVSTITVGGQKVDVDFDTGSSDLWVFSSQLDPWDQLGHQVYNHAQSPSSRVLEGSIFNCSYGDGSGVMGPVALDSVDIGGVTVSKQAVGMAALVTDEFVEDTGSSGLLGLAFSSLNRVRPEPQKTFFDNVMKDLEEPVFTADLRKVGVGSYEFGRVDDAKYSGNMTWVPVDTSSGFWQFTSDSFSINGGPPQKSREGAQAIADTGTTIIMADPALVDSYYALVPGAFVDDKEEGYVFPCATELPMLSLDIGGQYMAQIPGDDIRFTQYSDTSELIATPSAASVG